MSLLHKKIIVFYKYLVKFLSKIFLIFKKHFIWYTLFLLILLCAIIFSINLSINSSFRKYTVEFFRAIPLIVDGNKRCLVGVNKTFRNYHFTFGYLSYSKDSIIVSGSGKEENFNPLFIYFKTSNGCPVMEKSESIGDDILKIHYYKNNDNTSWDKYYVLGKPFPYIVNNIFPIQDKNIADKKFFYFVINDHIEIKMDRETRSFVEVKNTFDKVLNNKYFLVNKNVYMRSAQYLGSYNFGDCTTCNFDDDFVPIYKGANDINTFVHDSYLAIDNKLYRIHQDDKYTNSFGDNPEFALESISLDSSVDTEMNFQYKNIKIGNYEIENGFLYYHGDLNTPISTKDLIILSEGPIDFNATSNGGDEGFRLISNNILKLLGVSEHGPVYIFGNYVYNGDIYDKNISSEGGFEPVELKEENSNNLLHFLLTPNLEVTVNLDKQNMESYSFYNADKRYMDDLFLSKNVLYMKRNDSVPGSMGGPILGFIKLADDVNDFSVSEYDSNIIKINDLLYRRGPSQCDDYGNKCKSYSLERVKENVVF